MADPGTTDDEAIVATRTLVLIALGAVAFIATTAFSIRDCDLLSGNGTVKLPLLDVDVPVHTFFFTAPVFLLFLFLYVHMDLRRAVEDIPATFRIEVWPLSEFPPRSVGQGATISAISIAVVWGAWPIVMLLLTWRVLPIGNPWLSPLAVTATALAIAITIPNYAAVHTRRAVDRTSRTTWAAVTLVVAGLLVTWTICAKHLHLRDIPAHFNDFKGADIGGLDLRNRNLRFANFTKASLSHAHLDRANLSGATFRSADVEFATFCGATLDDVSLRAASGRGAEFACGARNLDLSSVNFSDGDFRDVVFARLLIRNLRGANLSDTLFWMSDLETADLSGADLTRADFSKASAKGARFDSARGTDPVFFGTELTEANFARARIERPNFTSAKLRRANLVDASLPRALLAGADLEGANMKGCNFSGADIRNTSFKGARYDRFTVPPEKFDYSANEMTLDE
jgi:uncharacterized protein YjbI with pentapeptide repeats